MYLVFDDQLEEDHSRHLHNAEHVNGGDEARTRSSAADTLSLYWAMASAGFMRPQASESSGGSVKAPLAIAVQKPLVFQNDVAYQSQGSLRLSVGTVVEMIGGDCFDDTLSRLHFVSEVVGKKVRDRSGVVGIQFQAPM